MEISISILLQIVTVAITAIALLTDYLYNVSLNKKVRTFNVVTQEMMQKLNNFRDAYAAILRYTDPQNIDVYRTNNKTSSRFNSYFAFELNKARAKIRTNSWPFWKKEVHLHHKMDELCKVALMYYEHPKKVKIAELEELRQEFFVECSIYDWAMWEYNQTQVAGTKIKRGDMDKHYYEVLTRINNSGSGRTLKFKEAFASLYEDYAKNMQQNVDKEAK